MNVEKLGGKVLGEPVDIPGSAYMYHSSNLFSISD